MTWRSADMCRVYQMPSLSVPESTGLRIGTPSPCGPLRWARYNPSMSRNHGSSLAGKAVLITGGARRLGRASALALARAGADVAITFLHSAREAESTVRDLRQLGVRALALPCDVTEEKSVRAAVRRTVRELGGIDVLVNNAANYETMEFDKL